MNFLLAKMGMIDGVTIVFHSLTILNDLSKLGVRVVSGLEEETGEIFYPKETKYKNLEIIIYELNLVKIRGSLHIYWHGNNYSDFTYHDLCLAIKDLCEKLNINPSEATLNRIEFGVNINLDVNPYMISQAMLAYKFESFSKMKGKDSKFGYQCDFTQYYLKAYSKSGQEKLNGKNIFRFEFATKKMESIRFSGIKYLSDLTNLDYLNKLGMELDSIFSELITFEEINLKGLSKNETRIYYECINRDNWEKFSPIKREKRKKQYFEIIEKYGNGNLNKKLGGLINSKWKELIEPIQSKSIYDLTYFKNENSICFDPLVNRSIHSPINESEKRYCKTCGRDITNQKKGSVFCSETIFGREAKRCRNIDSNPRNNFQNREARRYGGRLLLFDVSELNRNTKTV